MKPVLCLLLLLLASATRAQRPLTSPEETVRAFFEGFSVRNADSIAATVTPDFVLLEEGAVWNMDTLRSKLAVPPKTPYTRTNQLEFYRTERQGHMAWVYYDNVAVFTAGTLSKRVHWLESAVLVQDRSGQWKIRMLHSTPVKEGGKQ
ncbi:MAG: nuclear transport factor 2 family protein [Chitinophagaceae bacterium]|nr:MAG: nuclear transport factor 2 family protein [Chitinophagaceae bacterium]